MVTSFFRQTSFAALFLAIGTGLMGSALAQPLGTSTESTSAFIPYENTMLGFSIEYPPAWIPVEDDAATGTETVSTVVFVSLPENDTDPYAESISVGTEQLPTSSLSLEQYTTFGLQGLMLAYPDALMIEESDNATLAGQPAHMIAYDATIEATMTGEPIDGRIMQIWTVSDDTAYVVTYIAERSNYETFLDDANRMVESFTIGAANNTTPAEIATSANNTASTNATTGIGSARQQLLSEWEQTPFGVEFSTFIDQYSDQGFGVYTEHNNIFGPSDTITLYVEPVGFTHEAVIDEEGNELYQINLTASVQISQNMVGGSNATIPTEETFSDIIPVLIVSHRQNTELYMTIPLYQSEPLPEGNYMVTYTIIDGATGENVVIEKEIRIAETVSSVL